MTDKIRQGRQFKQRSPFTYSAPVHRRPFKVEVTSPNEDRGIHQSTWPRKRAQAQAIREGDQFSADQGTS